MKLFLEVFPISTHFWKNATWSLLPIIITGLIFIVAPGVKTSWILWQDDVDFSLFSLWPWLAWAMVSLAAAAWMASKGIAYDVLCEVALFFFQLFVGAVLTFFHTLAVIDITAGGAEEGVPKARADFYGPVDPLIPTVVVGLVGFAVALLVRRLIRRSARSEA